MINGFGLFMLINVKGDKKDVFKVIGVFMLF